MTAPSPLPLANHAAATIIVWELEYWSARLADEVRECSESERERLTVVLARLESLRNAMK